MLAAEPEVLRAHLAPATPAGEGGAAPADGTLCLVPVPGAEPGAVVRRVATALAGHEALRARLARGLDLAVLPPDVPVPGEPLHSR